MDSGKKTEHDLVNELELARGRIKELEALLESGAGNGNNRNKNDDGDFVKIARRIFDKCCEATGATSGYVALLSSDGTENEVVFLEAGGLPCTVDPELPMPIRGLREQAYKLNKAVYENDFSKSEWVSFMPAGHVELKNVLFAPLITNDKSVGLIGLANKPGDFTEVDAKIARMMGDIAAVALENSRMKSDLDKKRDFIARLTEVSPVGIIHVNKMGEIVFANRQAEKILGLTLSEIQSRTYNDVEWRIVDFDGNPFPDEKLPFNLVKESMQSVFEIEHAIDWPDGRRVYLSINASPNLDENGRFDGIVATFDNISDRRSIEHERSEVISKWKALIENIPDYVMVMDREGTILFVNKTFSDLTPEIITGTSALDYLQPELQSKRLEMYHEAWDHKKVINYETQYISEAGSTHYLEVYLAPIIESGKVVGLVHSSLEITDRKLDELKLKQFKFAVESSSNAIGISDASGKHIYHNRALSDLFGYETAEDLQAAGGGSAVVKDPHVAEEMFEHIQSGRPWSGELDMLTKSGKTIHAHEHADAIMDEDGNSIGLIGVISDITEKKRLESKATRFSKVLENSLNEIFIFDAESLRFIDVNLGARKNLGYSIDELRKITPLEIKPEFTPEQFYEVIAPLKSGAKEKVEFTTVHLRKDGTTYPVEVHLQLYSGSEPIFVAIILDITQRRRDEQALKESEEIHRAYVENAPEGIFVVDSDGKYIDVNRTGCRMTGYTKDELLGRTIRDLASPKTPPDNRFSELQKHGEMIDELILLRKDGSEFYASIKAVALPNGAFMGFHSDITERKKAEQEIVDSALRLESVMDSIDSLVYVADLQTHEILYINKYGLDLWGDIVGQKCWQSLQDGQDTPCPFCTNDLLLNPDGTPREPYIWELQNTRNKRWYECHDQAIVWKDGKLARMQIAVDITERKEIKETLLKSERMLSEAQALTQTGHWTLDTKSEVVVASDELLRIFGLNKDDQTLEAFASVVHPDDFGYDMIHIRRGIEQGDPWDIEHRLILRDGTEKWVRAIGNPQVDDDGKVVNIVGTVQDITEKKRTDELFKVRMRLMDYAGEHTLDELLQNILDEVCEFAKSAIGFLHFVNEDQMTLSLQAWSTGTLDEYCKAEGKQEHYPIEEAGVWVDCIREKSIVVHNDYESLPNKKGLPEGHAPLIREMVVPIIKHDKIEAVLGIGNKSTDYTDYDVEVMGYLADVAWTIIERKIADQALVSSESLYRQTINSLVNSLHVIDRDYKIILVNESLSSWLPTVGSPSEVSGLKLFDAFPFIPENDRLDYKHVFATGEKSKGITIQKFGDLEVCVETKKIPIKTGDRVSQIVTIVRDLTAEKHLEAQLLQAQKMEAVGTLAGGIAHDFNNLLTGILGHSNLLKLRAEPKSEVYEAAKTIEKAAERAADLTAQLLGFARKGKYRQVAVNIHETILEVVRILGRTIDKNISIVQNFNCSDTMILGDPGQIQQVVMNLSINAADAMPDGGKLVFSTENILIDEDYCEQHLDCSPGGYIILSISDDGSGISKETISRIFEPFFTTKPEGKGSGMGLAMVYGIVKNHNGFINVYSEIGEGTIFKIYFPLEKDEQTEKQDDSSEATISGSGSILIIDDEEIVRNVATEMLREMGYQITTARDGMEGVGIYKIKSAEIDLVILDMVMPEMGGQECFAELKKINPNVKVILSTGFGIEGKAQKILEEGAISFIQKPYRTDQLSNVVAKAFREIDS